MRYLVVADLQPDASTQLLQVRGLDFVVVPSIAAAAAAVATGGFDGIAIAGGMPGHRALLGALPEAMASAPVLAIVDASESGWMAALSGAYDDAVVNNPRVASALISKFAGVWESDTGRMGAMRGLRVLAADPCEVTRQTWSRLLAMAGFEPVLAGSAEEAMSSVRVAPVVGAAVSLAIPGATAAEVLREARANARGQMKGAIAVAAAGFGTSSQQAALAAGFSAVYDGEQPVEDLMALLLDAIDGPRDEPITPPAPSAMIAHHRMHGRTSWRMGLITRASRRGAFVEAVDAPRLGACVTLRFAPPGQEVLWEAQGVCRYRKEFRDRWLGSGRAGAWIVFSEGPRPVGEITQTARAAGDAQGAAPTKSVASDRPSDRRRMIEAVQLALRDLDLPFERGALSYYLDGLPAGRVDLTGLWQALTGRGIAAEAIAPRLLALKSWEAKVGFRVDLPSALGAQGAPRASGVSVQPRELDQIGGGNRAGALAVPVRSAAGTHGVDTLLAQAYAAPETERFGELASRAVTDEPAARTDRKRARRWARRSLVPLALATAAALSWAYVRLFTDGTEAVDAGAIGKTIPLIRSKRAGEAFVGVAADSFVARPRQEQAALAANLFEQLKKRGFRTVTLTDDTGRIVLVERDRSPEAR